MPTLTGAAAPGAAMARPRRFDWDNLWLRIVSGAVLAPAALAIAWYGGPLFLVMIAVAVSLLSLEWALMVAPRAPARVAVAMTASVLSVVFLTYGGYIKSAMAMIAFGSLASAVVSRGVTNRRADAAYGVLYV